MPVRRLDHVRIELEHGAILRCRRKVDRSRYLRTHGNTDMWNDIDSAAFRLRSNAQTLGNPRAAEIRLHDPHRRRFKKGLQFEERPVTLADCNRRLDRSRELP